MLRDERWQAFDLQRSPMLRVKLLKLGEEDHILLRTTHHIASDGWSEAIFHRELQALYEAYSEKRENPLPPLPVQYADFAMWQRCLPNEKRLGAGLEYWKQQLAGMPEELECRAIIRGRRHKRLTRISATWKLKKSWQQT